MKKKKLEEEPKNEFIVTADTLKNAETMAFDVDGERIVFFRDRKYVDIGQDIKLRFGAAEYKIIEKKMDILNDCTIYIKAVPSDE